MWDRHAVSEGRISMQARCSTAEAEPAARPFTPGLASHETGGQGGAKGGWQL